MVEETERASRRSYVSDSFTGFGEPEPRDPLSLVKDPLSEVTRKERRALLGISAIGLAMVNANLVPSKISALGIDFNALDQVVLLRSLGFVILFFLLAFIIYAASDYFASRLAYHKVIEELKAAKKDDADSNRARSLEQRLIDYFVGPTWFLRVVFEFIIPVIVAIVAVVLLFRHQTGG